MTGERTLPRPVSVRFPDITTAPGSNPAKRVLMLDASVRQPDHRRRADRKLRLHAGSLEIGREQRSTSYPGERGDAAKSQAEHVQCRVAPRQCLQRSELRHICDHQRRREQLEAVRNDTDTKITALLNDDQKTKFAAWQQERKRRMERRQGPDAPAPPGA